MKTIGERIAYLRELNNLSQRALMDELKFSNLSRIEKNESLPGIDIVISLSNYFNVSTDWLLKGKEFSSDVKSHQESTLSTGVDIHLDELNITKSSHNSELLQKLSRVSREERIKVEGIIDGLLLSKELNKESSTSTNGEEAATNETA